MCGMRRPLCLLASKCAWVEMLLNRSDYKRANQELLQWKMVLGRGLQG